jgi:hypothetical protein
MSDASPVIHTQKAAPKPEQITNAYLKRISEQIADHTRLMESRAEVDMKILRILNDHTGAHNRILRSRIVHSPVSTVMWGAFFGIFVLPVIIWIIVLLFFVFLGVSLPMLGGLSGP